MWEYLKDRVYAGNALTCDVLKNNIQSEIRIPHGMFDRVITNLNM